MSSSTTTTLLSEAYRDHPLHVHHIIPLDFNSVCSVPESHTWPNNSDDLTDKRVSVPVIDLRDPRVTQLIGHACENWGVFQLINHGIPLNLIKDAESEARRLFALPARQKLKALRAPGGATGYGIARITPFFDKYMWHEGFTIMGASSTLDHAQQLWPDNNHAKFCDAMGTYQKKMNILAEKLTKLIIKSMDISEEQIAEEMNWVIGSTSSSALQLNSYPSCPEPDRALGLAPHRDTSLITILHQSTITGLQVFKQEVGWVPVKPVDGALIVNIGDFFHILSNARFTNVLHRVFVNQSWPRISLAYFYSPPTDSNVVPLVMPGQVARYRSVTVKEFIGLKAKCLENALPFIKI